MKTKQIILVSFLILSLLAQDTILSTSGDESTEVVSSTQGNASVIPNPPSPTSTSGPQIVEKTLLMSSSSASPSNWSFLSQKSLGGSSTWMTPNSTSSYVYPKQWITNYTVTFNTDCPQNPVTITISATGWFTVLLNGTVLINWSQPWPNVLKHTFKPLCGCNVLTIIVFNYYVPSPCAMIYSLSQNTAGCYNCSNLGLTFYNRKTCQCQCVNPSTCSNSLMHWYSYPICGCKCNTLGDDSYCISAAYWNHQTCQCQCKPRCCTNGTTLNPSTCQCVKSGCQQMVMCPTGYIWNTTLCKCVSPCPTAPGPCTGLFTWDDSTCRCACKTQQTCNGYATWLPSACACRCLVIMTCPAGYFKNTDDFCSCFYGYLPSPAYYGSTTTAVGSSGGSGGVQLMTASATSSSQNGGSSTTDTNNDSNNLMSDAYGSG